MKKLGLFMLCTTLVLSGCANESSNEEQINQLQDRITELQVQNDRLNQEVRNAKEGVPSGVIAVESGQNALVDGSVVAVNGSGYEHALNLFQAGDLDGAISGFLGYLNSGEATQENAELSTYWLGEAYYTKQDFQNATRYFGMFIKAQPQSQKAQLALPKLIASLKAIGRSEDAAVIAQQGVSVIQ